MVRRKRPYVPKIKGCYQCSQRRVDCDGMQPSCGKCVSRGISCSGFGVKYSFRDGLRSKQRRDARDNVLEVSDVPSITTSILTDDTKSRTQNSVPYTLLDHDMPTHLTGNIQAQLSSLSCEVSFMDAVPYIDCWKRSLLTYFSENISPEMVVIDDQYNGWRRLILPIACVDELVLNSVMAVSSFHLSGRDIGQFTAPPRVFFAQAIYELQKRRHLNKCDLQTKQFVILAIIVLLVTVMVNGCSDFPILFHMLQSALDTIGGDNGLADGDLADFLRREIHKMRAYGTPFIGQVAGRQVLDSQNQESFDCLQYYGRLYSDHSHIFHRIASLKQQAYLIYMRRIAPDGVAAPSTDSIERFKSDLETFTEGSLGEHTLIWPAFIAASESRVPENRRFFAQFLMRQYRRSRFVNISKALDLLKHIWSRNSNEDWTTLLPGPGVFIM